MKFLRNLFSGKGRTQDAAASPAPTPNTQDTAAAPAPIRTADQVDMLDTIRSGSADAAASKAPVPASDADLAALALANDKTTSDILRAVAEKTRDANATAGPGPGIWDMDASLPSATDLLERAQQAPAKARGRRVKTRLVGFDTSDGGVVDLFKDASAQADEAPEADTQTAQADIPMFPVGWILVIEGPGRGASFPLLSGMSQIGRGADQTVRLDFGDSAISRSGHAAIVYDDEAKTFLLGQSGKTNIVRLNGSPVIQNEDLEDGDRIKVGETVLQLKTLCGADFDWSLDDAGEEDEDDVAIA